MSGHIFFSERWYGFDDAMYTAARLLEILSRSDDPSAVLNALPTSFSTPELNVPCAEGEPHAGGRGAARAGAASTAPSELITIDGLRADYADGFGLIRASATPRRCWCCASRATRRRRSSASSSTFMAALRAVKPDAQFASAAH